MEILSRVQPLKTYNQFDSWAIRSVAFSADSRLLAALQTHNHGLSVINLQSGQITSNATLRKVKRISASASLSLIACARRRHVQLLSSQTFEPVATLSGNTRHKIRGIAFNYTGNFLVLSRTDKSVEIWDAATQTLVKKLAVNVEARYLALNSDGSLIAVADDELEAYIWNVKTENLQYKLVGHSEDMAALAFSPDGTLLASGSADESVKVWDVASGKLLRTLTRYDDSVTSIAFHPNGKLLAATYMRGVDPTVIWDVTTGEVYQTLNEPSGEAYTCAFSPDGKLLAAGGNNFSASVNMWEIHA
jgi:WD40 repeat protein